jgi:tetratricopeptide (TPR) repeat protein
VSRPRAPGGRAAPRPTPKRAESLIDRIEDRLHDALPGFHQLGAPADPDALADSGVPEDERGVWERWDGVELAAGEARVLPLGEQQVITADALDAGIVRAGDRVIAERGRDLFVLPADPWEEGAAVVMVEEAGDRSPEASSVAHLLLGWLGECAILFDDRGEFHDIFDEHTGELQEPVVRKLCRRRLDLDEDAPNPRLRLAELLRRAGELEGARQELVQVLRRAPGFGWAHHELGRVWLALGERARAVASFREAATCASEPAVASWCLMWAAWAADGEVRTRLAAEVIAARPELAAQQAGAATALMEREQLEAAREQVELGLAILPTHLELLRLRAELG